MRSTGNPFGAKTVREPRSAPVSLVQVVISDQYELGNTSSCGYQGSQEAVRGSNIQQAPCDWLWLNSELLGHSQNGSGHSRLASSERKAWDILIPFLYLKNDLLLAGRHIQQHLNCRDYNWSKMRSGLQLLQSTNPFGNLFFWRTGLQHSISRLASKGTDAGLHKIDNLSSSNVRGTIRNGHMEMQFGIGAGRTI